MECSRPGRSNFQRSTITNSLRPGTGALRVCEISSLRVCRLSLATWLSIAGAILSLAVGPAARAQQTTGGFTSVEYFPQPNQTQVRSRLAGAEAQPMPGGLLVIKQLKLECYYTNGSPQAVVEAPECVYDPAHNTANSAGHLHLRSGDGRIRIDGDGFLWRQDDTFLTISNHVHEVIETGPETNGLL